MSALDLDAIEAAARGATMGSTGVWSREMYEDGEEGEGPHGVYPGCPGPMVESKDIVIYEKNGELTGIADVHHAADSTFIIAAQPSVVLALVAAARQLPAVEGDEIRVSIETSRARYTSTVKMRRGVLCALSDAFLEAKTMWSKDTPDELPGPDAPTPATRHIYAPSIGAASAEDLCGDHAAEALREDGDRYDVTVAPPGRPCSRCAAHPAAPASPAAPSRPAGAGTTSGNT